MKDLLEVIAKNLVDYPEKVSVKEISEEHSLILELYVAPEDMWKLIGKHGRIAKAIRTVVKACAIHEDKRVIIEIKQP